jgi:hypothetical protein
MMGNADLKGYLGKPPDIFLKSTIEEQEEGRFFKRFVQSITIFTILQIAPGQQAIKKYSIPSSNASGRF